MEIPLHKHVPHITPRLWWHNVVSPLESVKRSSALLQNQMSCTNCSFLMVGFLCAPIHCYSSVTQCPHVFVCGDIQFMLVQHRGDSWVPCFILLYLLLLLLAVWSRNHSHSCDSTEWSGIVSKSVLHIFPPLFHLLNLSSYTSHGSALFALLHIVICVYFVTLIIASFALQYAEIHFQYFFLSFAWIWSSSHLSFLFHLFYFSHLFSPLSSSTPHILLYTGGESAVSTKQHRCGG